MLNMVAHGMNGVGLWKNIKSDWAEFASHTIFI
jgi:hypothetical protein